MSSLHETPSGERLHISIFGRRNAGKSSLINALTGQSTAIVSDVAGTTTDPVGKAMEILPIGPVMLTDTAGIDDEGELGELRVARTMKVLDKTDLAVLVVQTGQQPSLWEHGLVEQARSREIPVIVVASKVDLDGDTAQIATWAAEKKCAFVAVSSPKDIGIDQFKKTLVESAPSAPEPTLLGDLVSPGDLVVMVVPIDKAAPKGRLILPQVMAIRDVLDHDGQALVVKERELRACLGALTQQPKLIVTDSQAFLKVGADTPLDVPMTSFSILMARQRGDLKQFVQGARAMDKLKAGDRVLIAEGCTHHKQGDDIGTVQIPRWLRQMVGGALDFQFCSGADFPAGLKGISLIVHCGSCTLNRRQVLWRQHQAALAGIPMTNYGVCLARVHGILDRALEPFADAVLAWTQPEHAGQRRRFRFAQTT